jgi:hypothetical protein
MNKYILSQSPHIGGLKNYHRMRQHKTLGITALLVVGGLLFSVSIQAIEDFSQEKYHVYEDSGSAIITIDRLECGIESLPSEVEYGIYSLEVDNIATSDDYFIAEDNANLTWGSGDCDSKSFIVTIRNDTIVENDESLGLFFFNSSTEEETTAVLIIKDNDAQSLQNYSVEQISELTSSDLDSRKDELKKLSSEDFSKISTNLDKDKVTPADVREILPDGWTIALDTGEITALEGDKLTLNILKKAPTDLSTKITLPVDAANLNAGFGVGGMGKPVIEELEESLGFDMTQDAYGSVVTAEVGGIEYIVIPDQGNISQVESGTPALSIAEGGFYSLTTADGLQIQVSPAAEPVTLSQALDDSAVTLGERGDTLMEIPQDDGQTRHKKPKKGLIVAIFSYAKEPAPSGLEPGFYERNTREGGFKTGQVVYEDNTAHTVHPTLFNPNAFIKEAKKFDPANVKEVVFNANGTFYVQYGDSHYLIKPDFELETMDVDVADKELGNPKIECCGDGLIYTIATDYRQGQSDKVAIVGTSSDSSSTTRQAKRGREIIIARPAIEPIKKDVCKKNNEGKIVCDFNKLNVKRP